MSKFILYEKAREKNTSIQRFLKQKRVEEYKYNQLSRASTSFVLNIAEGNGRFTVRDRRHFFIIARGSVQESIAIFDMLCDEEVIALDLAKKYKKNLIELLKILTKLISKY